MSTENAYTNKSLQELSGSDYEIADGQPDIRGWDMKTEDGKDLGKVKELLFDEQARKVRYIILNTDGNEFGLDERKVLIPIGIAKLNKDDDDVILPGVTAAQLQSLPVYEKGKVGSDFENSIRSIFAGAGGTVVTGAGADFYSHEHFNEDNFYRSRAAGTNNTTIPVIQEELEVGKRQVETGGVRLKPRIVETGVEQDINLSSEKVSVDRTVVDRPASSADFREDIIELTESKEIPVITKQARVVEEVSLTKEVNEEIEVVRDTVRNTEVEVERTGKDGTTTTDSNSF